MNFCEYDNSHNHDILIVLLGLYIIYGGELILFIRPGFRQKIKLKM